MSIESPIAFKAKYITSKRNRLVCLLRLLFVIPFGIVDYFISSTLYYIVPVVGIWLVIVKHYPQFLFDFIIHVIKFKLRYALYFFLVTDEYPTFTDIDQMSFKVLKSDRLDRFKPLYKWFLAIPHFLSLIVLAFVLIVVFVIGYVQVVFFGKMPRFCHNFVVNYYKWWLDVFFYALFLVTDEYPKYNFRTLFSD